jgi:outer membrane protein assembly factor BamB
VTAFDRESGAILWLTQLAEPLKFAPTLFDGIYYAVCGQQLVTIDAKGQVTSRRRFTCSVLRPLVVIENYIYAAGSDGALHKVDRDTLTDVWTSAAQTYSVITDTPILVETMLVFGTEDGHVLGIDRVVGGRRLDVSGVGPVAGSIVSDGQMLYFGTANYYLYCYSRLGDLVWRAAAEGIMQEPPVMAGERLYAAVVSGGLIALERKDGSITWRNNGVQEYVSTNGSQVFATSSPRDMLAVDTGAGEIQTIIDTQSLVRAMKEMKRMGRQRLVFFVGKDGLISWDTAGGEELAYGRDERVAGVPGEKQEVISFESNLGPVQIPVNKAFAGKVANLAKDQLIFAVGKDGSILVLWKETETQENASRRPRVFSTSGQRELWVLDAANGRIQARVDASKYDIAPRNLAGDGLVFLASRDGRIICLRAK